MVIPSRDPIMDFYLLQYTQHQENLEYCALVCDIFSIENLDKAIITFLVLAGCCCICAELYAVAWRVVDIGVW